MDGFLENAAGERIEGSEKLRLLHLEDDPLDAELACATLEDDGIGCEVTWVQTREDFEAALEEGGFDIVLADYSLPAFDGLSALEMTREVHPELPFILVSGAIGEELAVEALRNGATDYVLKHRPERLVPVVRRAMREAEERSKRRRAEEELRESHALLRSVVEGTDDAIFLKDARGRYQLVNSACARVIGKPAKEILGKNDSELLPAEVSRPISEVDRQVMSTGETLTVEENVPVEGASRTFLSTKSVYRDHRGEVVGIVGIAADITERKRAEEALHEVREAERSRIARDLHDVVLQDLTYAMQAVQSSQTATPQDNGRDTEPDEVLAALRRSVRGLRGAVYDLRLEAVGEEPFSRSVASLVEQNRRMNPGCEVELEVSERFPEKLTERTGKELLRIVQEALANARRHSEARRVQVTLGVSEGKLWAEVGDDGRGFDLVETPGGLGSRGMRERTRALGGDLKIESEPREGTKVRLEIALPLEGYLEPEEAARILLVDDHASLRQATASVFEREPGLSVVGQAGSLSEARRILAASPEVDVAIVDLGLPDGSGEDLIWELRARNPQAQALVLSASLDRVEIARAVEAGAVGVLHKSVGMDEVVEAVRRLRVGEVLLPWEEVADLLRFAGSRREEEHEARQAIAQLTPREKEVLRALAEGLDGKEIAERLHISAVTERNHMASISAKLGVHSRLQALVFAARHGIADI